MFKWSCPADPADSMPLLDISRHAGPGRPLSPLALKNFATKEMLDHHVHHYNKPNIQTHTSNSHASLGNASLHVWLPRNPTTLFNLEHTKAALESITIANSACS